MSVANITQAEDEVLALFRDAWAVGPPSNTVPVLHEDVADRIPDSGAWVRVSFRNATGEQASLAGAVGTRTFRYTGFVTAQIFTPTGNGKVLAGQLAAIAKNAFEGRATTPGDVWMRNARIVHVGQEGSWYQTNVLADFEYDEVR